MPSRRRYATGEQLHDLFHEVFALRDALSDVMDDVHERAGLRTAQCRIAAALPNLDAAKVAGAAALLREIDGRVRAKKP